DVVRDDGGVARVVIGDPLLDRADEVGTNVRSLRVDPAADAPEESHRGTAETEAGEHLHEEVCVGDEERVEEADPGEADEREPDEAETHDGARVERDAEGV